MVHAIQVINHQCNRFTITEFKGAFSSGIGYHGVQGKLNIGSLINPSSINANESAKSLVQDLIGTLSLTISLWMKGTRQEYLATKYLP